MAKDLGQQLEMQLALNAAIKERQELLKQQNTLLQNQSTLEKQLSGMYKDKARDTSTLADNMRDMASEAEKSGKGTEEHNKSMDEQIKLADRLRGKQKKNAKDAQEQQKGQKKQEMTWKDVKKAAGDYFKNVLKNNPKLIGAFVGMQRALKDVATMFKGIGSLIGSVVKGAFNIGKAILALPFKMIQGIAKMQRKMAEEAQPLRDAIEGTRKAFGGLNTEMGTKVMKSFRSFKMGAKDASLGGRTLMSVFGYGSAGKAKFLEAINKSMAGLQKFAPLVARTFSKKNVKDVAIFQHTYELSEQALAAYATSAHIAGQDIGKALKRASQAAKSMAEGTGLSTKDVLKGMGEMKTDFTSFGHLADEEMAAAVVSVKQFGGSVKDLKAVMDKFMNFENAANSVSTLNQAFGMQLDALDMLKAKNPADQIEKMRKAFFATGRSIEDLTMHEKKLLQQQTGLSDEMMKGAFSMKNQGKSYDSLKKKAEDDKKKKLDQTKVLKELADALAKFTGLGQDLQGTGDALGKGFTRAISLHPAMRSLMKTTRGFLLEVRNMGWDLGNLTMDLLSDTGLIGGLEAGLNAGAFKTFRKDVINSLRSLAKYIQTGEGSPENIAKSITAAFEKMGNNLGGAGGKLGKAFDRLGEVITGLLKFVWEKFLGPALGKMFKYLGGWIWDNKWPIIKALAVPMAVILGWVMLKASIGAAAGALMKKAIAVIAAKMAAGQGFAAAGQAMVGKLLSFANTPMSMAPFKKAGGMIAGNIGKFASLAGVAAIGYGIIKGVSGAFDEYEKTGSMRNAGNQYIASFVSGITFGLVDSDGVRLAMDKWLGRDFKSPMEEAFWHMENTGTKAMKRIGKDLKGIISSADAWDKYAQSMKNAMIESVQGGKVLSEAEYEFAADMTRWTAEINRQSQKAKADAEKMVKETGLSGARMHDMGLERLARGPAGSHMSGKSVRNMVNTFTRGAGGRSLHGMALEDLKKQGFSKELLKSIDKEIMNARSSNSSLNWSNIAGLGNRREAAKMKKLYYQAAVKQQKLLVEQSEKATADLTSGAKDSAAYKEFQSAATKSGIIQGKKMLDMVVQENAGNVWPKVEQVIDNMEKVMGPNIQRYKKMFADYGVTEGDMKGLEAKLKEMGKGSKAGKKLMAEMEWASQGAAAQYGQMSAMREGLKNSRLDKFDTDKQIKAAVDKEINLFTEQMKKKDPNMSKEAIDAAVKARQQQLRDGFAKGAIGIFSSPEARKAIEAALKAQGGLTGKQDARNQAKLAKLEAAAKTVERIEKLKDMPKRLKALQSKLEEWDPVQTAKVAKGLFCKIKMIIDAINQGVIDSGINGMSTVLDPVVAGDIKSVGGLVKGVNDAMNVKSFPISHVKNIIDSIKYTLEEFGWMTPYLDSLAAVGPKFADTVLPLEAITRWFGDAKTGTGFLFLASRINANYKTLSKLSKRIPRVVAAIGLDAKSGMNGVISGAKIMFTAINDTPQMTGGSQMMFEDMAIMAEGVGKFANKIEKVNLAKFGKAGTIAKIVGGFVESYNKVQTNLQDVSKSPADLSVRLQNFANALGVDKETFQIKSEALNFTVNVEVKIDADQLIEIISDPKKVTHAVKTETKPGQNTGKKQPQTGTGN